MPIKHEIIESICDKNPMKTTFELNKSCPFVMISFKARLGIVTGMLHAIGFTRKYMPSNGLQKLKFSRN